MKKHIIILLFLLLQYMAFGQTEVEKGKARDLAMQGVQLTDDGRFKEALSLLNKSIKLDPSNLDYVFELAYTHYKSKQYKKAIRIGNKLIKQGKGTEKIYQLVGNAWDLKNKPKKALKVYHEGLDVFPESGKLHLESGIAEYYRNNFTEAVMYWEKGIQVAPMFESNYYWLAKVFINSDEAAWGVIYGELFMNLERNSKRTEEMSKWLFDTYKRCIYVDSDTTGGVSFTKKVTINMESQIKIPFSLAYGMVMALSLKNEVLDKGNELTLETVSTIRKTFIEHWFQKGYNEKYPNVLFDFQKMLLSFNFLEEYNYWFLLKGREGEFEDWFHAHRVGFESFATWFAANPLVIDKNNLFLRTQ